MSNEMPPTRHPAVQAKRYPPPARAAGRPDIDSPLHQRDFSGGQRRPDLADIAERYGLTAHA